MHFAAGKVMYTPPHRPAPPPVPNPPPEQSEVDDLKQRLLDLETRMASLKD